jgi:hypothetical protein
MPQSTQNSISQRVSYPAAQPNAFANAHSHSYGGSSQRQFQQPQQSPRMSNSHAKSRVNAAASSNSNAFSNAFGNSSTFSNSNAYGNAFSNSNAFSNTVSKSNAFSNAAFSNSNGFPGEGPQHGMNVGFSNSSDYFSRASITPVSSGFQGRLSQQPRNAFAGANPQHQAQPGEHQQQSMHLGASSTAFNAFSSSKTPREHTGMQKTMTPGSVMPMSNAFAGYAPAPPSLAFPNVQACASRVYLPTCCFEGFTCLRCAELAAWY